MLLNVPTKQGQLQVLEQGVIQIAGTFGRVIWQVPCRSVTGFGVQMGMMMGTVEIRTTEGSQVVEMLSPQNFQKLSALFPGVPIEKQQKEKPVGHEWYHDLHKLTHIATYTNEMQMQKEVEASAHFGWQIQSTAGAAGHINVGRTVAKAALTGGAGLLFGASRSKDKITITFTRTQQWLEQHPQH